MNKVIMHLVKHELYQLLVSLQILQDKRWKTILMSCLYSAVIIACMFYCGGSAFGLYWLGSPESIMPIYINAVFLIVLMTTLMKAGHQLYGASDIKMLMSYPVSLKMILMTKCSTIFLMNWLIAFVFLVSGSFVLGLYHGQWHIFFMSMICCPFLVLIPMSIGIICSSWIFSISSKFKNTTLMTIVLLCGFMFLMPSLINVLSSESQIIEIAGNISSTVQLSPFTFLAEGSLNGNVSFLMIFIVVSIALFWMVFQWISRHYLKVLSSIENQTGSTYSFRSLRSASIMKALIIKEFRHYFSSSLYVSNTLIGLILGIVLVVVAYMIPMDELIMMMELPVSLEKITLIFPAIFAMVCSMCCTSACALSLEGKGLWLIQSLPVCERDIKISKIWMNLMLNLPIVIVGSFLIVIRFQLTGLNCILGLCFPVLVNVFSAINGMLGNVLFQNYRWTNEVQVIKQGLSVLIGIFVPMIVSVVMIVLLIVTDQMWVHLFMLILILLVCVIEWHIIQRKPIEG